MKFMVLQDNLTKVKAVEETFQQMLRFPDNEHQAITSQLVKQRELRSRQVNKSDRSENSKVQRERTPDDNEGINPKGRKQEQSTTDVEQSTQCSIDFLV